MNSKPIYDIVTDQYGNPTMLGSINIFPDIKYNTSKPMRIQCKFMTISILISNNLDTSERKEYHPNSTK